MKAEHNLKKITSMKDLKHFINKNNIRIVKKKGGEMLGYAGIHYGLNDEFGLKIPRNTVWIDQNLRGGELFRTLKHELVEMSLMKKGRKYFSAHKIATRSEVE